MPYNFLIGNRKSNLSPDPSVERKPYTETLRKGLTMDPKAMFLSSPAISTFSEASNQTTTPTGSGNLLFYVLSFNDPYFDYNSLTAWNSVFNLPTNGTPFTEVNVIDYGGGSFYEVSLTGGYNITLQNTFQSLGSLTAEISGTAISNIAGQFYDSTTNDVTSISFPNLLTIADSSFESANYLQTINFPNLTTVGDSAFKFSFALTSADFPNATSIGTQCFYGCQSMQTVYLPSCVSMGLDPIDDSVFQGVFSGIALARFNVALQTINGGSPHESIVWLQNARPICAIQYV